MYEVRSTMVRSHVCPLRALERCPASIKCPAVALYVLRSRNPCMFRSGRVIDLILYYPDTGMVTLGFIQNSKVGETVPIELLLRSSIAQKLRVKPTDRTHRRGRGRVL